MLALTIVIHLRAGQKNKGELFGIFLSGMS